MSINKIKENALKLDKAVKLRNLRETLAGLIVAIIFTMMGLDESSLFRSIACFQIAISGVFICVYINHQSFKKSSAHSIEDLDHHKKTLERQIKLLGSIRYWYVFPIATGFFALQGHGLYEALKNNSSMAPHLISLVMMTLLSLFIIYLNEFKAVQELQKELTSLSSD